MIMFNQGDTADFWDTQQDWKLISWKLHSSSGVHTIMTSTGLVFHMLVESKYPLTKEVLSQMLELKLETEEESSMALELIKFVKQQLEEFEDSNDDDTVTSTHEDAERSEIDSIVHNNTWKSVDLPSGHKPIGHKWIFKRKLRPDGTIEKYKARLVAKGYRQKEGQDFFDTYSPVTRITSIRTLIAIAAIHNLIIHQMDVKTAFLNEAEFVALDKAAEEAEWLRSFQEGIHLWPKPVTAMCINCDSMATLTRAKNHIYNGKSRHIRRRHNTIKDLLRNGIISIDYVKSKENIADPLTKDLCKEQVIFTLRVEYYGIFLIGITYARLMCARIFGNQMAKFSKIPMNKDMFTTEMNTKTCLIAMVAAISIENVSLSEPS
ncbi:retrotransposon protein, putative, ty1-copia subclass [Tanacetum coccineum]